MYTFIFYINIFFKWKWAYSVAYEPKSRSDTSDLHSYPPKMLPKRAFPHSSCVLSSHDSSIDRTGWTARHSVPRHPSLFFLPLIPDRWVNEIDAVGVGQVNYARFLPKISSRSANGQPLAMGIVRRESARRSRLRRTRSFFFLSSFLFPLFFSHYIRTIGYPNNRDKHW